MKRIFLSMPMTGRDETDIRKEYLNMIELLNKLKPFGDEEMIFDWNYECEAFSSWEIDKLELEFERGLISEEELRVAKKLVFSRVKMPNLLYLGEAIKKMANCDVVVFAPWTQANRGVNAEWEVCRIYGIPGYQIKQDYSGMWKIDFDGCEDEDYVDEEE